MKRYDPLIEDRVLNGISGQRLMEVTRTIASRVRTAGTAEETLTFRWIERHLRDFGYNTGLIQHEAYISIPGEARLLVDGEAVEAIAHAFSASTAADGLTGELVFLESADAATPDRVAGKIVLTPGAANGHTTLVFERAGAIGQVYIHDDHLHETSVSPVWGNPTPETIGSYPATPGIAVRRADGERLRELTSRGPAQVTIQSQVETGWRQIPLLVATTPGFDDDEYLLLTSHVDSWHYGAMDNAAANATLIEVARQIRDYRRWLRRGLTLVFWSGHSQGRFAGSAWFADKYWRDLRRNCVGHVYVDSTGGLGATVVSEAPVMAETKGVAAAALKKVTGEELEGKRIGRFADQSFYGIGIPCTFGTFSEQPAERTAGQIALRTGGTKSGGLGWWWHTTEDTIDKVDQETLVRDTRVYAALVFRLLSERVLPYDYRTTVDDLRGTLRDLQGVAGRTIDLNPLVDALDRLESAVKTFYSGLDATKNNDDLLRAANQTIMELGHHLIPINYHERGFFDHGSAEPLTPIPSLQPIRRLAALQRDSDAYFTLLTRVRRSFNWVLNEIEAAADVAETAALLFGEESVEPASE